MALLLSHATVFCRIHLSCKTTNSSFLSTDRKRFTVVLPGTHGASGFSYGLRLRENRKGHYREGSPEAKKATPLSSSGSLGFVERRGFMSEQAPFSVQSNGSVSVAAAYGEDGKFDMEGKTVIVTGANTGMGVIIAKELALRGAKVIMACRSEKKGRAAEEKVWREVKAQGGPGLAEFSALDLSQLSSVRKFVDSFKERNGKLDCLINNAGIMVPPHNYTPDGFESQFQVNYLSHYLLTRLLAPVMQATSETPKVIHVSSLASENVAVSKGDFDTIARCKPEEYNAFQAYRFSKLGQVLFTVEMNRRIGGSITVNSVHPGIVNTELFNRNGNFFVNSLIGTVGWAMSTAGVVYTPEKGASTAIYLATTPSTSSGGYFADCAPRPANPVAFDASLGSEWWEESAKLVGLES